MNPALPPSASQALDDVPTLSALERMEVATDRFLVRFLDVGGLSFFGVYFAQSILSSGRMTGGNLIALLLAAFVPARLAALGGYRRLARWWFLVGMTAVVLVWPAMVNGLRTPVLLALPLVLLLSAWLLGRRAMLLFAGVFGVALVAYWFAETSGRYVPPLALRPIETWLVIFLEVLALTAAALWVLVKNYENVQEVEGKLHELLAKEAVRSNAALKELAEIYDGLSAHVCVLNERGVIVSVNRSWRDFFVANGGSPHLQHEGTSYLDACTSAIQNPSVELQDAASFYVLLQELLAGKREHFEMEYPCHSQTEKRWFFARVSRIAGVSPTRIVVTHDDVTLVKLAQEQLRASLAFTRNLIDSMQEGFSVLDGSGRALDANPALCRMTGFHREELVNIKAPFPYWPPEAYDAIGQAFERTLSGPGGEFELTFMRKNGERFPASVIASAVKDDQGQIVNYVATVSDITERKLAQEQIHRLAFYDPLTNLPNRRLLTDRMSLTLANCKRSKKFAALLVLDLDNFKTLNDAHGHAAGDLLLLEAAQRLRSCVREIDTVARFGGDEFVVLIQELCADRVTSSEQVRAIAEKILFGMAQPYRLRQSGQNWLEHHCTASIGVALFNETTQDAAVAVQNADQAMYQAKQAGRNRICFHDPIASV